MHLPNVKATGLLVGLSLLAAASGARAATTPPTLPQAAVSTTYPSAFVDTCTAGSGPELQACIDAAAAGDPSKNHEIVVGAGKSYPGPFYLQGRAPGSGWVVIRSSAIANLPEGVRVTPSAASSMPTIVSDAIPVNTGAAMLGKTNAHHYRIVGLDFVEHPTTDTFAMIQTMPDTTSNVHHLIFDRVLIKGTPGRPMIRGIQLQSDGGHTAVLDSYIGDIKAVGSDTQAVLAITNPGPILYRNNFLESTGENIMFCGGTPASDALMPRDITIERNLFSKQLSWATEGWLVKTLLELKCGVRVLIQGNEFKNMPGNDGGMAFRFTVRNETGQSPYADVSDVTFRHNIVHDVANGINMFGCDDQASGDPKRMSKHVKRFAIVNNLWYALGKSCTTGSGCGAFFSIVDGATICTDGPNCRVEDLAIRHNTVDGIRDRLFGVTVNGERNLDFDDNLIDVGTVGRGLFDHGGGTSSKYGADRLGEAWGATWTWMGNRIAGSFSGEDMSKYPQPTNSYVASSASFLWKNPAAGDYHLLPGSPALGAASDAKDQGVDLTTLEAAFGGTLPSPGPDGGAPEVDGSAPDGNGISGDGSSTPSEPSNGGCDCQAGGTGGGSSPLLLALGLGILVGRRRRARASA